MRTTSFLVKVTHDHDVEWDPEEIQEILDTLHDAYLFSIRDGVVSVTVEVTK